MSLIVVIATSVNPAMERPAVAQVTWYAITTVFTCIVYIIMKITLLN